MTVGGDRGNQYTKMASTQNGPLPEFEITALDFLSGIHALGELGGALNSVAAYTVFLCYEFCGTCWLWPILGFNLSRRMLIMSINVRSCHLLGLVLPTDQIRFLCIRQVAAAQLVFADPHNGFVAVCEK